VFVGNLGEMDNFKLTEMIQQMGAKPVKVRVLTDETGRPKGAAFVDLADSKDFNSVLAYNGKNAPGSSRPLRINPADNKGK